MLCSFVILARLLFLKSHHEYRFGIHLGSTSIWALWGPSIDMPGPGFELRTSRSIISALVLFQPQGAQIQFFFCGEVPERAVCEVPVRAVQFCYLGSTTFP